MSGILASAEDLVKNAALIFVETLETLVGIFTEPWKAHTYCDRVGLPPTAGSAEWAPAVADLRKQLDAANKPEHYAQIAKTAAVILGGIQQAFQPSKTKLDPADTAYRLLIPILLQVAAAPKSDQFPRSTAWPLWLAIAALSFIDQRLQDDYAQGLFEQRWLAVGRDLAKAAGWISGGTSGTSVEVDWAPLTSDVVVFLFVLMAEILKVPKLRPTECPERARRWGYYWYGFDHPTLAGFEKSQQMAQKAFTMVFAPPKKPFTADAFQSIQPQRQPTPPGLFTLTLVPVPKALDPAGKGQIFLQGEGFESIDVPLGAGWKFTFGGSPSFGILASPSGVSPIGDVSFQVELSREWGNQPSTAGPSTTSASGATTSALSFEATRFSLGVRADSADVSGWLTLEKGELAINGGHWLSDYVPKLRFSFDITAEASVLNGIQFQGGAGGDLLIPVNERIPFFVGAVTIRSVRIRTMLGTGQGDTGFSLAATTSLTLELLGVLTLTADGLGASYAIGTAPQADGNVAGAVSLGWNLVLPQGAGLSIGVWKIKGGGALLYDSKKEEISGAIELDIGTALSLKGLGIYQSAHAGTPKNWLAIVTLQTSYGLPAVTLDGLGVLYASNRGTDPQAFLDAVASGNLSALLFGNDVVANAPQYLAALDQLFPPADDSHVMGVMAHFSALSGRLTLALGVLFEYKHTSLIRTYVVGRFTAICAAVVPGQQPDPKKAPIYILADGVAIWDSATDTLNIRISLRNSRIWGGELTGGASVFHGVLQAGDHPSTYISVGGFHPDFTPPPALYVPPRLTLGMSNGDHIKIAVKAYLAITPSSFQAGLEGSLEAHLYGFGIRGDISIDIMCGFDWKVTVTLAFSVELLLGSESIAAVAFSGTLAAYSPTVLSGKVSVSFLFWSISKSGSLTIQGDDGTPQPQPDVAAALASAIADTRNWESSAPAGLSITDRARDGVWISPNAPLRLRQATVPLNVAIERFGPAVLSSAQTFRIDSVQWGGAAAPTQPTTIDFAPAMFLNLSREEMLAAHGFETLEAGVEISRPMQSGDVAATTGEYEEIVIDPKSRPVRTGPSPISTLVLGKLSVFAGTAASGRTPIQVSRERFTVIDSTLQVQAASKTLFEARAALRAGWRVVPEAQTK